MINILIVDDQPIIREGIKLILERDREINVLGTAGNGIEALEMCGKYMPDVILMDILMPVCNGIEGTRIIKSKYPAPRIIIITTFNDDAGISKAIKYGAHGYILKDADPDELISAIKNAANGLQVAYGQTFDLVLRHIDTYPGEKSPQGNSPDITLTTKECDIIRYIVYGKSNKEIASIMKLSDGGIRNSISNILSKLKLKDRTQLAVFAVKSNLI